MKLDLNCDLGESFGHYKMGNDAEVMKYITSANIACGFHAGDPVVMEQTIKLALKNNVAIGAHPGYPDILGFGRRVMNISNEELRAYLLYQISALKGMVEVLGGKLEHVKLHGALYNQASKNYDLAKMVAHTIKRINPELIFVGLANSQMVKAAKDVGLQTASEVFADRAYTKEGLLAPRDTQGAVITNTNRCLERVAQMIRKGEVESIDGEIIPIKADTVCIHGDNQKAMEFSKSLRTYLEQKDIEFTNLRALNL